MANIRFRKNSSYVSGQKIKFLGGAGQISTKNIGGGGGLRPLIDANHIHVWNCDETSGTTLVDSVGGANLTINGTSGVDYTLGEQPGGSSVPFIRGLNAATSYVMAQSTGLNVSTSAITLEYVVRMTELPGGLDYRFISRIESEAPNPMHGAYSGFITYTGQLGYGGTFKEGNNSYTSITGYINSVPNPTINTTYHMMFTYDANDSNNVKFYINGVLAANEQQEQVTGNLSNMTKFTLGGTSGYNYSIAGYVRDVRVSNIARDATYGLAAYAALV